MPMAKLLVTGAGGFLGRHICQIASPRWQVLGTYRTQPVNLPDVSSRQVDLVNLKEVSRLFKEYAPDAVIHAAAESRLGACQKNAGPAHEINVTAGRHIAELCGEAGTPCVFTSTDIVFDGTKPPYRETDPVSPVNIYGEQKALAEQAMAAMNPQVVICRLSLVFGPNALTPLQIRPDGQLLATGTPLKLFVDEFRTPIWVFRAVEGLLKAITQPGGIFHLGGRERISRYEFGLKMAKVLNYQKARILPCRQKDVDLGAPRPPDVSLDIQKALALELFSPLPLEEEFKAMAGSHCH